MIDSAVGWAEELAEGCVDAAAEEDGVHSGCGGARAPGVWWCGVGGGLR